MPALSPLMQGFMLLVEVFSLFWYRLLMLWIPLSSDSAALTDFSHLTLIPLFVYFQFNCYFSPCENCLIFKHLETPCLSVCMSVCLYVCDLCTYWCGGADMWEGCTCMCAHEGGKLTSSIFLSYSPLLRETELLVNLEFTDLAGLGSQWLSGSAWVTHGRNPALCHPIRSLCLHISHRLSCLPSSQIFLLPFCYWFLLNILRLVLLFSTYFILLSHWKYCLVYNNAVYIS